MPDQASIAKTKAKRSRPHVIARPHTVYCSEDDYEAVCFTALSTPLCQDCREMYERGQLAADIDHDHDGYDVDLKSDEMPDEWFDPVFKMGYASPDAEIFDIGDVRIKRTGDGAYRIRFYRSYGNPEVFLPYDQENFVRR